VTVTARLTVDRSRVAGWLQDYGVYAAVGVLLVFNVAFTANFPVGGELPHPAGWRPAPVCVVALGMALVIGTEGVDLSVGAVMALSAALVPL